MAKENELLKMAAEKGLIDQRKLAVVADVSCTDGNNGRGWVFLNGDTLYLYEQVGFAGIGEPVEKLDLKKCRVLKSCSFILMASLKLQAGSRIFLFKNFGNPKQIVEAIRTSCEKK